MYIEDEAVVKENVGKRVSGRGKTRRALIRQSGLYSARRPSLCPTLPTSTALQSLLQCNPHKETGATEYGTA